MAEESTDNGDPFLPESGDPTFSHRCSGGSAGINSAVFFTCLACGAAIVEMEFAGVAPAARRLHVQWHRAQNNGGEASP